jgi:hypothetical protein
MTLISNWDFRDRVLIDGDASIVGVVTAFMFRAPNPSLVEVSWVHNGEAKAAWFEEWRLKSVT